MRWLLVSGGQRAVGAKVDIGTASASLVGTYVTLGDIQITNPRRPRTNLVAADRVELDFDSGALLHKRAVANRGIIRGLRFGTPRAMSGELPNTPHDRGEPIPEDAASEDNIDLAGR